MTETVSSVDDDAGQRPSSAQHGPEWMVVDVGSMWDGRQFSTRRRFSELQGARRPVTATTTRLAKELAVRCASGSA